MGSHVLRDRNREYIAKDVNVAISMQLHKIGNVASKKKEEVYNQFSSSVIPFQLDILGSRNYKLKYW